MTDYETEGGGKCLICGIVTNKGHLIRDSLLSIIEQKCSKSCLTLIRNTGFHRVYTGFHRVFFLHCRKYSVNPRVPDNKKRLPKSGAARHYRV